MSNLDLTSTTIGGRNIVLKTVPARDARRIQTMLIATLAEPLSDVLSQDANTFKPKDKDDKAGQMLVGLKGIAGVLTALDDEALDKIIDTCKPYILVDGKQFNENEQFTADSLMDMYEVLWFFLKETFGGFISAVRSRFPQLTTQTALSK